MNERKKIIDLERVLADYVLKYGASPLAVKYFSMGFTKHSEKDDMKKPKATRPKTVVH